MFCQVFAPIFFMATLNAHAAACKNPRPVGQIGHIPACENQTTCLSLWKLSLLREYELFPSYGESADQYRLENCGEHHSQMSSLKRLIVKALHDPGAVEDELAVTILDDVKARVENALKASRARMNWVSQCVDDLKSSETFDANGAFNPASTTKKFLASGGHKNSSCAALWDPAYAKTPILQVLQNELSKARMDLALSNDWSSPKALESLKTPDSAELSPLTAQERDQVMNARNDLLHECLNENRDSCLDKESLKAYAAKKYVEEINQNPILPYFKIGADSTHPLRASDIQASYKAQQEKMNSLSQVKLDDQDYLKFPYFVNETLKGFPKDRRGDACEVANFMLVNFKAHEARNEAIMYGGLAFGGTEAIAAKGVLGRLFRFMSVSSYFGDAYIVSQMATHYEVLKKVESLCAQSHLKMPDVCEQQTILGNSDSLIEDGVSLGASGFMTAMGLYGPAKALIGKALSKPVR